MNPHTLDRIIPWLWAALVATIIVLLCWAFDAGPDAVGLIDHGW